MNDPPEPVVSFKMLQSHHTLKPFDGLSVSRALWVSCSTAPGLTETTGTVTPTAVRTVVDTVLLL